MSPSASAYAFSPAAHRGAVPLSSALLAQNPSLEVALRAFEQERLKFAEAYIVPHLPPAIHHRPSLASTVSSSSSRSLSSPAPSPIQKPHRPDFLSSPLPSWTVTSSADHAHHADDEFSDDEEGDYLWSDEDEDEDESEAGDEWEVFDGQMVLSNSSGLGASLPDRETIRAPPPTPAIAPPSSSSIPALSVPSLALTSEDEEVETEEDVRHLRRPSKGLLEAPAGVAIRGL